MTIAFHRGPGTEILDVKNAFRKYTVMFLFLVFREARNNSLTEYVKWELPSSVWTADNISQWMLQNTEYEYYRPIGRQSAGLHSFRLSGVTSFAIWSRTSSLEQKFELGCDRDYFAFFNEKSLFHNIAVGSRAYEITARSGLITSIDRCCALEIKEGAQAEGSLFAARS